MLENADAPSGELFRLAFDLSPSGMLAVDSQGLILLANREVGRLFGYSPAELLGKPVEQLIPARFRTGHPVFRTDYFHSPQSRPMGAGRELYGLRRDGTEFPVEIGLNPLQTEGQVYVLSSILDISARRKSEAQLRQSQKMEAIGTLAGGIAHDFNNILLSIIGHTELAQRETDNLAGQRADLEQVLTAAERGRQLVQRILTFSRQREVTRSPLRLEQPVREALQLLRASLPTTIEMFETLDPATPLVLSDSTQIHQVLMNLATNAAHAMPQGGVLEVRLAPDRVSAAFAASHPGIKEGLYARLTVIDSGHGMPQDVIDRAFEPFFTTKPPGTGTGLGLAVIHGIVQAHGGAVEIHSRPESGTRVEVYLPAHAGGTVGGAVNETERLRDAPHILVVEDEPAIARLLERQIRSFGYKVTVHTSSVDAWADFQARPDEFAVLVTDNTMPRMTGLALAELATRMRPELPVLLTSGLAELADPAELRAKGVRKLLPKPHTSMQLADAIRELARG